MKQHLSEPTSSLLSWMERVQPWVFLFGALYIGSEVAEQVAQQTLLQALGDLGALGASAGGEGIGAGVSTTVVRVSHHLTSAAGLLFLLATWHTALFAGLAAWRESGKCSAAFYFLGILLLSPLFFLGAAVFPKMLRTDLERKHEVGAWASYSDATGTNPAQTS